jgi:preprotein translocase SecE subunit
MADQPAKRRVRNPETFRERALKAADEVDKPKPAAKLRRGGGKIFSPVGTAAAKAGRVKPVRILGKVIFPAYFRRSLQELRQVQWPSWGESRRLTYAVLLFAVIFGVSIAIVDYGLDKLFKQVLLK